MLPKALVVGGVLLFAVLGTVAMLLYMSPETTSSPSFLNGTVPSQKTVPQVVSKQAVSLQGLFHYKTVIIGVGVAAVVLFAVVLAVISAVYYSQPTTISSAQDEPAEEQKITVSVDEESFFDGPWKYLAIFGGVVVLFVVFGIVWNKTNKQRTTLRRRLFSCRSGVNTEFDLEELGKCKTVEEVIQYQRDFAESQPQGWSFAFIPSTSHPHSVRIVAYGDNDEPARIFILYTSHEPNRAIATVLMNIGMMAWKCRFGIIKHLQARRTTSNEPTQKIFYFRKILDDDDQDFLLQNYLPSALVLNPNLASLQDQIVEPYMIDLYFASFKYFSALCHRTGMHPDMLEKIRLVADEETLKNTPLKNKLRVGDNYYVRDDGFYLVLANYFLYKQCKLELPHLQYDKVNGYQSDGNLSIKSAEEAHQWLDYFNKLIKDPQNKESDRYD